MALYILKDKVSERVAAGPATFWRVLARDSGTTPVPLHSD